MIAHVRKPEEVPMEKVQQVPPPEVRHAEELARLAEEKGSRSPGWLLTPQAVVAFVCGNDRLKISRKFVGDVSLVERCVITLAGERALLLVGEPGTAKSMLSELLSAAICGISGLTVQGSAGTTEDQLRYGWNYAQLLARGPSEDALVDSPVLAAMRTGRVALIPLSKIKFKYEKGIFSAQSIISGKIFFSVKCTQEQYRYIEKYIKK